MGLSRFFQQLRRLQEKKRVYKNQSVQPGESRGTLNEDPNFLEYFRLMADQIAISTNNEVAMQLVSRVDSQIIAELQIKIRGHYTASEKIGIMVLANASWYKLKSGKFVTDLNANVISVQITIGKDNLNDLKQFVDYVLENVRLVIPASCHRC
jgi:hypothetical protein